MRPSALAAAVGDLALVVTRNPFPELAAVALALAAGGLHFLGLGGEAPPLLLVAALGVAATGVGVRAAVDRPVGEGARLAGLAVALGAGLFGTGLAAFTVHPGTPEATVEVTPGETARLPVEAGPHRLLVTGRLAADRSSEDVHYDLAVGEAHARGEFARTWGRGRVGRRQSVAVANEHTADFHDLTLAASPDVSVQLDGPLAGPVRVAAYPALPRALLHGLAAAALLAAVVIDDRLKAGLKLAVAAAAALCFGELVRAFGVPGAAAFGPIFGSAAVGAILAGVVVWLLSRLVGRFLPRDEAPVAVPAKRP